LSQADKDQCAVLMKEYHTKQWQQEEVISEAAKKIVERKQAGDENSGSHCMAHIMETAESFQLNQNEVAELLSVVDADGVALRKNHQLKQQVYRVRGPNHIWASEGHEILKCYGSTMYGITNTWSCQILSLKIGKNNNNP
ncbi:hypothetical protein DFH28DRAFT_892061, partial [Melampsora americana]